MAKVIELCARDLTPKKVKWVAPEQRAKLIEFAKPVPPKRTLVGAFLLRARERQGSG